MTADEYRIARETYRAAIGAQPLAGVLRTTALTADEARAALIRSGDGDDALLRDLQLISDRLIERAKAVQLADHLRK